MPSSDVKTKAPRLSYATKHFRYFTNVSLSIVAIGTFRQGDLSLKGGGCFEKLVAKGCRNLNAGGCAGVYGSLHVNVGTPYRDSLGKWDRYHVWLALLI